MTFNADDIEDASEVAPPTEAQIAKVAKLANDQQTAEKLITKLEADLISAKATLKDIAERDLPAAMKDIRTTGWKLEDGSSVELIEIIRAGIKEDDNKPEALKYVRDVLKWADLIKTTITVSFGKGEEQTAARLIDALREDFPNQEYEEKEGIHAQTLGAAVRDYLDKDADKEPEDQVPLKEELLGVFRQRITKIKPPKKSKKKDMI